MDADINWQRYQAFLSSIPKLKDPAFESTHWGPAIKKFIAHEIEPASLTHHVAQSEFGFRKPSLLRDVVDSTRALLVRVASALTWHMSDSRTARWEHARAIAFLQRRGRYGAYRTYIKELGIGSDMQTIRHYHYLGVLQQVLERGLVNVATATVVEIGGGAGNFAVFAHKSLRPRRYILVDLPSMLAYSAFQILSHAPEISIVYPEEWSIEKFQSAKNPTVFCLTPKQFESVPSEVADVILNFTSFSEMDESEIKRYFSEVYRTGRSGSIFYNVNRLKRMRTNDGRLYTNNPFLFPYKADDVVLEWGLDEFHHETRGGLGTIPTLTVTRISKRA